MNDKRYAIEIKVVKGCDVIYHKNVFMDRQQLLNMDCQLEIQLSPTEEDGILIRRVIYATISNESGKYSGILSTTYIDRKRMEEKICEIEAMLDEYGVQLNGNKHKYDAHLISISEKQFTTQINQKVDVLLSIKQIFITK